MSPCTCICYLCLVSVLFSVILFGYYALCCYQDGEFDVYEQYAESYTEMLSSLDTILSDERMVAHFRVRSTSYPPLCLLYVHVVLKDNGPCSGFLDAVRYVLPKLLLFPIYHCFSYFDTLKLLPKKSPDADDKRSLTEAHAALLPLHKTLERSCHGFLSKKRFLSLTVDYVVKCRHFCVLQR